MEKIVKSGIKVDFHIHSICSTTKDSSQILKNSNKDNIPLLVRNLNAYEVQMCSITDHDTFDYDLYKALQKYEDDQSSTLVKILPGVEFSVMFNRKNLNFSASENEAKSEAKNEAENYKLTELEERLCNLLLEYPELMQSEIRERLDLSRSKVQRMMRKLTEDGIIIREGSRKKGYWTIHL